MIRSKEKRMVYFFLLAFSFGIACCSNHERKSKSLTLQNVADFRFRRSYANIQFDENLNTDSIEKSNPEIYDKIDTVIINRLLELGIVDKHWGLIRSRFSDTMSNNFQLSNGDLSVTYSFQRLTDSHKYSMYDLIAICGGFKDSIMLEGRYGAMNRDISYLLLDIIPGGFKEIVVLNEIYFMMGDNSDIYIYETKLE